MTTTIRVVAAVVDVHQLTLYREDGNIINIPQGDPRLSKLVDEITPILTAGGVAEVELDSLAPVDQYRQFQDLTGAVMQLFVIAKNVLGPLLNQLNPPAPVAPAKPAVLGAVPNASAPIPVMVIGDLPAQAPVGAGWVPEESVQKTQAAVAEIMANARPVSSNDFVPDALEGDTASDTLVAVVEGEVITGVEKLQPQIAHALKQKSAKGMEAFMKRIAKVAKVRRHSVEDLLKFMEKGDLPIADDGSIIIYKILRRKDGSEDTYVDCHTGKVPQKVGSYVCMHESLVDHNRGQECSNGLHVARRQYLGAFPGDVVVLAKVAPEDVIAVPLYDANKMRVCGYHILFELSEAAFKALKKNLPFTNTEEAQLVLGRAISGDHVGRLEEVRITENNGGGVTVTPLVTETTSKVTAERKPTVAKAKALEEDERPELNAPQVSPKAVQTAVKQALKEAESRSARAQRLWAEFKKAKTKRAKADVAQVLLDHKRSTKVGWTTLGLDADAGDILNAAIG